MLDFTERLKREEFGELLAWKLTVEYAAVGYHDLRPHAHLYCVPGEPCRTAVQQDIEYWWSFAAYDDVLRSDGENGFIGGFDYASKGPLGYAADSPESHWMRRLVLEPFELADGQYAAFTEVGGDLMNSKGGAKKLQARERFRLVREAYATRRAASCDPDYEHRNFRAGVKAQYVPHCPDCRSYGTRIEKNGTTKTDEQRYRCKSCARSWTDRPVFHKEALRRDEKRKDSQILRYHSEGVPIRDIKELVGVGAARIKQVLGP